MVNKLAKKAPLQPTRRTAGGLLFWWKSGKGYFEDENGVW